MTTIEKVKAKILDLAIRGKLVPQDPNDEPAAELLKRIRAEKEKLVKAKKIKKEKNPSEIVIGSDGRPYEKFADGKTVCIEDEIPFDLPKGWAWARLGTVCDAQLGKMLDKAKNMGTPFKYLANVNVRWGSFDFSDVRETLFTPEEVEKFCLRKGDVVMCEGGVPGRCAVWKSEVTDMKFQKAVHRLRSSILIPLWVQHFFAYAVNANWFKVKLTGTTIKHLPREALISILIPVPPLVEQKRIVSKIEELFAEVEKIGSAKDGITRTVERINKKVLDLAIRGQLVPQDPNDEPAEELLKRIAEARQQSAKTRKSKHEESVIFRSADRSAYETRNGKTVCINDEIPFDIPDSWAWARLGSISDYGKCVSIDTHILPSDTWSLDLEEIEKGTGRLIERKTVGEKVSTSAKHVFKKGMVLYSKLRTYLNKVLIADVDGVCTSEIIPITLEGDILPEYLRHVLMSSYFLAYTASKDYGVKMPRVGTEDARKALIPIPPLAEQKRIVAKIEEIRTLVELIART